MRFAVNLGKGFGVVERVGWFTDKTGELTAVR
jgi:hypothetical protein